MIEIKNRWSGEVLRTVGAETLENANLENADLRSANLENADLRSADLRSANLRSANLRNADLRGADLRGADLGGANLRGADLRGADLRGADLGGADLRGADLESAAINWQSHALIAELLRQQADDDPLKRMVAGLVAISTDWCWDNLLRLELPVEFAPVREWALETLAACITEGDDTPAILRRYANKEVPSGK